MADGPTTNIAMRMKIPNGEARSAERLAIITRLKKSWETVSAMPTSPSVHGSIRRSTTNYSVALRTILR